MRIKLILSYDGSRFYGFQVQPNQRTVQEELEKALKVLHKSKEKISVISSGRTDSGVHAVGQCVHFDSPLSIPDHKWPYALNSLLPPDIVVRQAETVDESFHARYGTSWKEYRYFIDTSKHPDVFRRLYSYHYPYPFELKAMQEAGNLLVGTHDFTSFCSPKSGKENKVRTIYKLEWEKTDEGLQMIIVGNGFLYNMVRIIVGTLLAVGSGKISLDHITDIIEAKNRQAAGKKAPAHGLYLWQVNYDN
ncbi:MULTISPECIES: tRNA pseudouridine(38-40) synthase TruA [Bacillus]|uniref:tRNA pseudouridine synthase A n=2 Tax=Bacillus TaxID=1386 RepID=A0A0M5JAR2_9BACI|nr:MULTISPECIES: tRNA pseudouridine(38-40) synthase TruA [Bacillus]ALC83364.1 tRNA pseudouridine synthase A [Bacillus gobiensis]MBP1084117.1 tRNA pseudouridine38-40 synthase [Bacillus capparidis]MED1095567.1 tRNA pseudouridine(38-40) synthase TruA [Bacillus capparidis]